MANRILNLAGQDAETIKEIVKTAYSHRIQQHSPCCGGAAESGCCESSNAGPGTGYYSAEEQTAGGEAATSSFGCGNPFAIAGLRPGETVLDLGSGAGFDAFLAARQLGTEGRVIGVDFTPAMLEKARANAQDLELTNVEFIEGDIEALPLSDNSVDVVISNCVINLAPDKRRVFREAFRVLKPGGRLAVSDVTLAAPLPPVLANDPTVYAGCIGGAILETEYLQAIGDAGFDQVEVVERVAYSDGVSCCGSAADEQQAIDFSIRVAAYKPA